MQSLTAPPRDSLTAAQVTAVLTGPTLTVSSGLELLNADLSVNSDISDDCLAWSVDWVGAAKIHRTCKVGVSRVLPWGTALVRPYQILSDGGVSARFNVGVFSLATPRRDIGESPETYDATGYDRLYLLDRGVGDTYFVAAGTGYLAAVRSAVTAAGLVGVSLDTSAEAKVLPADRVWPLVRASDDPDRSGIATSWLRIINDLLGAVGYRGLYADEQGLFRSEPYADPASRGVEFTFDADSASTVVGERRSLTEDLWAAPNKWVLVQGNPAAGVAALTYTVTNAADGITSVASRGLTWVETITLDAADAASLQSQGDRIVAQDKRIRSSLSLTTGPFPLAGHNDVVQIVDAALGQPRKAQASRWSLDSAGSDVSWEFELL